VTARGAGEKVVQVNKFSPRENKVVDFVFHLECLKLTKATQKTCETLQTIANLHDGHVCVSFPAYIYI
jgi:hypothetical protein